MLGEQENQKHKQYKLVLKSSELDPSLLPRLLCFRSSRSRAMPMGAPSVVSEGCGVPHLAAQLHSALSTCSSSLLLGQGGWTPPCFARGLQWVEGGSAGQGPGSQFRLQWVWLCQGGSGPASLQVGWWRFWWERGLKIKLSILCLSSSSRAEHVHPENQSRWERALAQGYYLGGRQGWQHTMCSQRAEHPDAQSLWAHEKTDR